VWQLAWGKLEPKGKEHGARRFTQQRGHDRPPPWSLLFSFVPFFDSFFIAFPFLTGGVYDPLAPFIYFFTCQTHK
jgi:hypothetical protein